MRWSTHGNTDHMSSLTYKEVMIMPDFGDMLSWHDKLELAVQTHTPRQLAIAFAQWTRSEYEVEKIARLEEAMFNLIFKHHGHLHAVEFIQELRKRTRR